jgi:hypothetical protein
MSSASGDDSLLRNECFEDICIREANASGNLYRSSLLISTSQFTDSIVQFGSNFLIR